MILDGIRRHEVFLGVVDDEVVSALSLTWSDDFFWGSDDGRAGYVHRLVVDPEHRGTGLGRHLLDWAQTQVWQAHRLLLRLDCLSQNAALRVWYESIGFTHQRDREVVVPLGAAVGISLYQRRHVKKDQP